MVREKRNLESQNNETGSQDVKSTSLAKSEEQKSNPETQNQQSALNEVESATPDQLIKIARVSLSDPKYRGLSYEVQSLSKDGREVDLLDPETGKTFTQPVKNITGIEYDPTLLPLNQEVTKRSEISEEQLEKNQQGRIRVPGQYVCCGDSVAVGQNMCAGSPKDVLSFGGWGTLPILKRLKKYTFEPGAKVPVLCGFNDCHKGFKGTADNIIAMCEYIRSQGAVPVCCIPHDVLGNKNIARVNDKFLAMKDELRVEAKRRGIKVADFSDIRARLHPPFKTHRVFRNRIEAA